MFLGNGKRYPSFCTCRNKTYICCNFYILTRKCHEAYWTLCNSFFLHITLTPCKRPACLVYRRSITDGNWGNACGMPKPTAERSLWDMNHIYGSGYMYLCASHYQGDFPERNMLFLTVASVETLSGIWRNAGKRMPLE